MATSRIKVEGFNGDEWFSMDVELEDASIDIVMSDGRWTLNPDSMPGSEGDLHVSWQGGRAADHALVRPVSQNHVVMKVDRSRRNPKGS